jgi:hypothetical protein
MPSFKYGARQFQVVGNRQNSASTTANEVLGAWEYLPAVAAQQGIDSALESIKSATLMFVTSVAQANSTAAGGSVIVAASQYNSAGASLNSATLYNQAVASQAALVPIDVTARLSGWSLSPGDTIVVGLNTNTVGIPASFSKLVLSGTIDTATAF